MALRPQHVAPELLNKVTKALGISALDQWYHVTHHAVTEAIGARVLSKFGGTVSGFLKHAYPHHSFDEGKLASRINLEKDQKFIEVIIRQLFPNLEIQTKARKAVGIVNPETDQYLEIDFWIPSLNLGIEYQDKHHYEYQWYANYTLDEYKKRDDLKKSTMATLGHTLVTIGYWWDRSLESVAATIRKVRPDLLQDFEHVSAEPVPSEPPLVSLDTIIIPGVAGIMSPFFPTKEFNPVDWYASEKYDGIRGVYNPALNKMFSRTGNELSLLPALSKDIPHILVEGEITAGRGNYTKTSAVSCHSHHDRVDWPIFRYVIFDIPDTQLGNYTQRYSAITSGLLTHPFVFSQATSPVFLVSKEHLKVLMDSIINDYGEGVITQQDVPYEYGRAKSLAKIKVRRDDDAQVLSVNESSSTCKLISGVTTDISFSGDFDPSDLKTGDIISYYHSGYSQSGLPKRAEIYKIRYDITWDDLIDKELNIPKQRTVKEAIGGSSLVVQNSGRNKLGHWNKAKNVRAFFDMFAKTFGFDPLVPENWYSVLVSSLRNAGGGGLLKAYGYSRKKALSTVYPEAKFRDNFRTHEKPEVKHKMGYWSEVQNVRAFFDKFAKTSGFDPLVPENWYLVKVSAVREAEGGGLLKACNNNLNTALSYAYPELKFSQNKFGTHGNYHYRSHETDNFAAIWGRWNKPANVRAFFDEFARKSGFDPHVPENWYSVTTSSLQSTGGGLLKAHNYNRRKALSVAYPELDFKDKFRTHVLPKERHKIGHWQRPANTRAFFDEFARASGFDSLVPENWYPVRLSDLHQANGSGLLQAFDNKLKNVLSHAYPELKFEGEFETHAIRGRWSKSTNVLAFFDEFARTTGFDPLTTKNWYPVTVSTLREAGGSGLLKAFGNDIKSALSCAYPELRFSKEKFASRGSWSEAENVRAYLDEFALTAGFDPRVPENWNSVRNSSLQISKGSGLLHAHGHDLKKALFFAYPELKGKENELTV